MATTAENKLRVRVWKQQVEDSYHPIHEKDGVWARAIEAEMMRGLDSL